MNTPETSQNVRLRVELIVHVDDADAVIKAAMRRVAADRDMSEDERTYTEGMVTEDTAEALAYLVDPSDLVGEVPGVELSQASWSSEQVEYDPDAPDWVLGEDVEGAEEADAEDDGEAGRG